MKTILFIEDESTLQKTLGEVLTKEDYQVISALDGEIGLRTAKEKKPDLILLDLILPKMNGFEVLKKIKEDGEIKDIPIIVLTNLESMEDIQKALELGAATYLVKANYGLEELLEKIKNTINE
ncbi:MAG: response regulator [Candidatus Nealsonbacteria bacterium]|nr:response regulator [Candidatus Nealsonbacteria bacterium]